MGEMADFALEDIYDFDEQQLRYPTWESAVKAGVEEDLYDEYGVRYQGAFSNPPPRTTETYRRPKVPKISQQKPLAKKTVKKAPKLSAETPAWDRIVPVENDWENMKILLYGKSATGKTTLWSSFPGPRLVLVCSGGVASGELKSLSEEVLKDTVRLDVLNTWDVRDIAEKQAETGRFRTVILDHTSGLADLCLKEVLGLSEIPAQKTWGLASQQQYGQQTLQMKENIRSLLNLDCNVVLIAQERDFNTDKEQTEILTPYVAAALGPSLVGWLNPAVDYVAQTFIRAKTTRKEIEVAGQKMVTEEKVLNAKGKPIMEYCLRVGPHDVFTTKFRVPGGVKEDVIVNPSYQKILEIIKGGRKVVSPKPT